MTLNEIFKIEKVLSSRATPYDIIEFLETEYYSASKDRFYKYGDLDLTHYIRSVLKYNDEETVNKLKQIIKIVA